MREMNAAVQMVYDSYEEPYRSALLNIRAMIFKAAAEMPAVGELEESLKWGQPTYSTIKSKSGTPIRLGLFGEDKVAMFFHCQTTVIEDIKLLFYNKLEFSKSRAIVLSPEEELPVKELEACIKMALTYHMKK